VPFFLAGRSAKKHFPALRFGDGLRPHPRPRPWGRFRCRSAPHSGAAPPPRKSSLALASSISLMLDFVRFATKLIDVQSKKQLYVYLHEILIGESLKFLFLCSLEILLLALPKEVFSNFLKILLWAVVFVSYFSPNENLPRKYQFMEN
jgi:hypothetical protein